jgi:RNA polymerase sigma-70 factor, ECF subfamily
MSSDSEASLLARCRDGDSAAWDEFFDLYYAATGRFVFQLSSNLTREDAAEMTQETFLAVINHIGEFKGQCRIQTWIFQIASNKTRDFCEKRRAAKRGGGQETISLQVENLETGTTPDPPSPAPAPDELMLNHEQSQQVGAALNQMDAPCREIIELRYFGDLSYEEISASLNLNEKTVSSRLSRCLDRLEKILTGILSGKDSSPFPV